MRAIGDVHVEISTRTDAYVRGMERLVDAVRDLASAQGLAEIVEIVRHAARELVDADGATFVLRDDGQCHYVDEDAIAPLWRGLRFPLETCISGWCMRHAEQVTIDDIYLDDRIPHDAYRPTFVRSLAMTPIRTADPVGAIGTYWAGRHAASPAELRLLQALADSTAVAMASVRVRTERAGLRACVGITRQVLGGAVPDPLRIIAEEARRITAADLTYVLLLSPDGDDLKVTVAAGERADEILGMSFESGLAVCEVAVREGRPMLVPDAQAHPRSNFLRGLPDFVRIGPMMVLPLVAAGRARGVLAIARTVGGLLFDTTDLDVASAFAANAAVALEFADARSVREEVALLEDRDKIAQSLYDDVVHRLFAVGLTVQGVAAVVDAPQAERLRGAIDTVDETIAQLRTAIYGLRAPVGAPPQAAQDRILEAIAELEKQLPSAPVVEFHGAIDTIVPARLVDDAVLVLREALTQVAHTRTGPHGGTGTVHVGLTVVVERDELVLEVVDDGGRPRDLPRLGPLANLRALAEFRGGSLTLAAAQPGPGTALRWVAPLS